MEAVMIEIPDADPDSSWEPPVLTRQQYSKKHTASQCCWADVFFAQYTVCILLLTAVLVLRLEVPQSYAQVVSVFSSRITAPDETWVHTLLALVRQLWS